MAARSNVSVLVLYELVGFFRELGPAIRMAIDMWFPRGHDRAVSREGVHAASLQLLHKLDWRWAYDN
jgi:hypothetical protein